MAVCENNGSGTAHIIAPLLRFLADRYQPGQRGIVEGELRHMTGGELPPPALKAGADTFEGMQSLLSRLNEKEADRKRKGVYYTPQDVASFLVTRAAKLACGVLRPDELHLSGLDGVPTDWFCRRMTVFDPTCGAGEFLLAALELKLSLLDRAAATPQEVHAVVSTIHGNDANGDSILITRLRLLLCVLERFGPEYTAGLAGVTAPCFESRDYVMDPPGDGQAYDLILGNPPYVEDGKSGLTPPRRYGNIYANVLEHAAKQLRPGGAMGFVVPLSYTATPRMKTIREELFSQVPEQYILSYSDRPDCLFSGVHQKLCILLGRQGGGARECYTGNYRYWYKEERGDLFPTAAVVKNNYGDQSCIPKLGTELDTAIFEKIAAQPGSLADLLGGDGPAVHLNMRAAFWIKVFRTEHAGGEYKTFRCADAGSADWSMCLLSSSLFWWYWVCVSDCWHITKKELSGFRVPVLTDAETASALARRLETRLEETKRFVGTKQTDYEYKHRDCIGEIHEVDDFVHRLYGLTGEESRYIKEFAYRYRTSEGGRK